MVWQLLSQIGSLAISYFRRSVSWAFSFGRVVNMKHCYEVTYYENDQCYKFRFPKVRGPSKIISIMNSKTKDHIFEELLPYMGPSRDFHNVRTTPNLLGYDSLRVLYRGGTVKTYTGNEVIEVAE